ncbi:MAG: hypothetical protein IJ279_05100 [Clostridia bacterium]|nr:hypothetical protein [Clostridia bacterium]
MKKIISIFLAILCCVAIFSGCEKTDRNQQSTTTETESATVSMTLPEVESSYNKKSRTMKYIYRDLNGEIMSISVITYTEKKQIESESTYDADDKLINKKSYKYDENSNIIEEALYNSENKLEYIYKDYEYKEISDGKFILIRHNRYNSEMECDTIFKYKYDENNNRIGMETYSPEGNLLTNNEF